MTNTVRLLTAAMMVATASPAGAHPAASLNLPLWQAHDGKPAGKLTRFTRLAGMFMGTVPCFSFRRLTVRVNLEIR